MRDRTGRESITVDTQADKALLLRDRTGRERITVEGQAEKARQAVEHRCP